MDLEVAVYARQTPNFLIYLQNMDKTQKHRSLSLSYLWSVCCHIHTLTQMRHKHTESLSLSHACKHTHMPTHTNMEDCRRLGWHDNFFLKINCSQCPSSFIILFGKDEFDFCLSDKILVTCTEKTSRYLSQTHTVITTAFNPKHKFHVLRCLNGYYITMIFTSIFHALVYKLNYN